MKKALITILVIALISLPVIADTVENSISFSIPETSIVIDTPIFNPELISPELNLNNTVDSKDMDYTPAIFGIGVVLTAIFCLAHEY